MFYKKSFFVPQNLDFLSNLFNPSFAEKGDILHKKLNGINMHFYKT